MNGEPIKDRFWLYTGCLSFVLVTALLFFKFSEDGICGTCDYFAALAGDIFYSPAEIKK